MYGIRYKIHKYVAQMRLANRVEGKLINQEKLLYFQQNYDYFVDILETVDNLAKMKIYMPDGQTNIGWQAKDMLELHFVGDPFDGRFNS